VLIYTPAVSSRFQYTIGFIESVIGHKILFTSNKDEYLANDEPIKINYSFKQIADKEYHILPHILLFHEKNYPISITVAECRNNPCFFSTQEDNHGFDVFAAIFYLITRYEEYLPHQKDSYGRYAHTESIAYKNNFLTIPLVNIWIKDLLTQLTTHHSLLTTFDSRLSTFNYSPTYDIDIAYAYNHQPIVKNVGGFFKDLIKGDLEKVIERANVYSGKEQDPFNTYSWFDNLHKQHNLSPIYFFLLAKKKGIYDKNITSSSPAMHGLVKHHAAKYAVGIHPSWQSGDSKRLLSEEIKKLENITQKDCTLSRQHYIRLTLPDTYRNLIANGIKEDYSMGYGSINGFRASVASPFYWYDLERDETTNLLIHPYCYMEANSYFEQHLSAIEAAEELQYYHDAVKAVGGQLITIFHNHFLTNQPQWKPWREMYEAFLKRNF
jgi:hypothetical protein